MLRKIFLCLALGSQAAAAQAAGPLGLGLVLIDPTGISSNYYYDRQKSLAAGLGWGSSHLHLNVDHLWYRRDLLVIDRTPLDVYFGVGARYYHQERRNKDDDTNLGVRAPVGVAYTFRKYPVQLFGELAPALNLIEESSFIIDLALGVRYYF